MTTLNATADSLKQQVTSEKKSYLICVVAAPEVGVSSSNKGLCEALSFNEIRHSSDGN